MYNDYSKKTEAELRYIIKDASEAARCMKDVDFAAECKYLDQVNDACTELNRRMIARVNKAPKWKLLEKHEVLSNRFGRIAEAKDELKYLFPDARIVVRPSKNKLYTIIAAYEV